MCNTRTPLSTGENEENVNTAGWGRRWGKFSSQWPLNERERKTKWRRQICVVCLSDTQFLCRAVKKSTFTDFALLKYNMTSAATRVPTVIYFRELSVCLCLSVSLSISVSICRQSVNFSLYIYLSVYLVFIIILKMISNHFFILIQSSQMSGKVCSI